MMVTYGYLMFYTSLQTFVGIQPSLDMWDINYRQHLLRMIDDGWLITNPFPHST